MASVSNLAYLAAGKASALEKEMLIRTHNVAMNEMFGYQALKIGEKTKQFDQRTGETTNFAIETQSYVDQTQGPLIPTEDYLDFALGGQGVYAQVTRNGETFYVRCAKGGVDQDGNYIALGSNAFFSDDGGSPIQAQTGMTIGEDGTIADRDGNIIGKLNIVKIADAQHVGDGLYTGTPEEAEEFNVIQGYLEDSNVNMPIELALFGKASEEYRQTTGMMNSYFKSQQRAIESYIAPAMV